MSDDVTIETLSGVKTKLGDIGIDVIDFNPPAPNWTRQTEQNGNFGMTVLQRQVAERVIPLTFDIRTMDSLSIESRRNEVFSLFSGFEQFYVISERMPTIRWLVEAEASFPFQAYENSSVITDTISINLYCANGFGESVQTSLAGSNLAAGLAIGMGFDASHELKYSFNSDEDIWVYNGSVVPLLAEALPVTIKLKGSSGSGFSLRNITTGQLFELSMPINVNDKCVIYGAKPVVNNKLVYDKTNHQFIDFKRGWNQLQVNGFSGTLSFETRFYY